MRRSLVRAPEITVTRLPAALRAWTIGWRGGKPDAAAHADGPIHLLYMSRIPEGPQEDDLVARLLGGELHGARSDCLEYKGKRAFFRIGIRDSEGDALAIIRVDLYDHELSGLALARDERGFHLEAVDLR